MIKALRLVGKIDFDKDFGQVINVNFDSFEQKGFFVEDLILHVLDWDVFDLYLHGKLSEFLVCLVADS